MLRYATLRYTTLRYAIAMLRSRTVLYCTVLIAMAMAMLMNANEYTAIAITIYYAAVHPPSTGRVAPVI